MLVRLLDAFVWKSLRGKSSQSHIETFKASKACGTDTQALDFSYVQGMNVLAGAFLYVMPSELEAFYCFSRFIEHFCPLYVQPTMQGVHAGLKASLYCSSPPPVALTLIHSCWTPA